VAGFRIREPGSISDPDMDGKPDMTARAGLAAIALFALGGSISGVSAADGVEAPGAAAAVAVEAATLPRFEPSFDDSFAPFDDPAAVVTPGHAVDVATIDPATDQADAIGSGVASWYGREFAGRRTASGERFDPAEYTAAHRTLPVGSRVRVTNAAGQSVVVRINDRGPFHGGRVIDLSQAAAAELGLVRAGSGRVELALLD
jgi:rare lipoprotein A